MKYKEYKLREVKFGMEKPQDTGGIKWVPEPNSRKKWGMKGGMKSEYCK